MPGVNLGVQTERDTDGQRVTGPNITLELPLFDQGQLAVARLGAQYRQAEHNLAALETNIRSEVRQAQDAMLSARGTVELYNQTLMPQRQKILRQTLLQYNAMQVSTYVLLQAKQSEQIAERSYASRCAITGSPVQNSNVLWADV
ncbi:MAG: TolC family protein [Verrucomicrobiota bacterium]